MPKLTNAPLKDKGGRPQVEIDLKKVELLARVHATDTEIAVFLGVSRNSIKRVKKRKEYQDAIERGRMYGKVGLRKAQWENAYSGNTTMQIFLGKAHLGQSDGHSSDDPINEVIVRVKRPPRP